MRVALWGGEPKPCQGCGVPGPWLGMGSVPLHPALSSTFVLPAWFLPTALTRACSAVALPQLGRRAK